VNTLCLRMDFTRSDDPALNNRRKLTMQELSVVMAGEHVEVTGIKRKKGLLSCSLLQFV